MKKLKKEEKEVMVKKIEQAIIKLYIQMEKDRTHYTSKEVAKCILDTILEE